MSFWNTVFTAHDAGAMAAKYGWLRREVLEAAAPAPAAALREAAHRWPGSLRECQRVHPERYRAREQWACQGTLEVDRAYAAWHDEGRAAICLWSELHRLTAEVLAWRATELDRGSGRRGDPAAFLRDLTRRDPGRGAAWPEEAVLIALCPRGVGPRSAEVCLAHRAGWDPSALRACLLDLR
jgi:hypothetical protein